MNSKQRLVVDVRVDEIIVGARFRRELGDVDALAQSLAVHGQLQPIAVTPERILIFGERRLEAAKRLGWPTLSARVIDPAAHADGEAALDPQQQLELAENDDREGFTPSERVAIGRAIESAIGERRGRPSEEKRQNIAEYSEVPEGERTADHVADRAGLGNRTTYRQARRVVEQGAPEVVEAMDSGALSISAAAKIASYSTEEQSAIVHAVSSGEARDFREAEALVRHERRSEKLADIAKSNASLEGVGRFPVLYADPPWRYEHVKTESRAIENQYPTMSHEEICALDIASVTTEDAVLFLWVTAPKLGEGLSVLAAWGFGYRTCLVWDKEVIGMGYWARIQHELLLVGTRGNPPAPLPKARPRSVHRERRGEHSAKPELFYTIIEGAFPRLPKLELFCRSPRDGWTAWGNQSGGA